MTGSPTVVWPFGQDGPGREGRWRITQGATVDFVEASPVTAGEGGQGLVCMFSFELGGVRLAHLGDVGTTFTEIQIQALGDVEVLFIPVGAAYTIGPAEGVAVINQLPTVRTVVPMQYFVEGFCPWPRWTHSGPRWESHGPFIRSEDQRLRSPPEGWPCVSPEVERCGSLSLS